ncbi:MAG: DeoR/GlpR family DNA-binding transcription regulator [Negativicutes bacterium]|nr:DeoR/GlpR family DNA-binding transcription regulator [Negativicutes bacterium]
MLAVKRQEAIMNILTQAGCVDAVELGRHFAVSAKTIRKDFDQLEAMGLLERVHGGAILKSNGNSGFPIAERKRKNLEEKQAIGKAALRYVDEGCTMILDGGTTTLELAKMLGDKKITVITNDLRIAAELAYKDNVTLLVTGGVLRRDGAYTLLGRDAERFLERYKVTKLFLGASAIDFGRGLAVFSLDEAEIKKAMLRSAGKIICLADTSKFHKLALVSFCPLERVDVLITDQRITPDDQTRLEASGIELHIADRMSAQNQTEGRIESDD